jgi:3-hydroxybutyryl-CoA dehydrogenase
MKLSDIKRVLILGSGTMGRQIGFLCALKGYNVVMYDISVETLKDSLKGMEDLGAWFISVGRMPQGDLSKVMGRIQISSDSVEAAKEADLISESVPDIPEIKAQVFARFNELCPERTIFTTNTSMLLPSMFAEQTGRPGKLVALHFHDVRTTDIVDVMPHPESEPETVELVRDFAQSLGQVVITLNSENSGYVFNSMLSTLLMSALTLAANGVASIEDVDRSWMGVMRTPIGPFGIMDQIGLSTVWTIINYAAENTGDPQAKANAAFVKQYIYSGALGLKTMCGFYSYPKPAYSDPQFISGKGAAR